MASEYPLLDEHPEWFDGDCPSCGARLCHEPFEHWACGSVMELNGFFAIGRECALRRQLSQRDEEIAALRELAPSCAALLKRAEEAEESLRQREEELREAVESAHAHEVQAIRLDEDNAALRRQLEEVREYVESTFHEDADASKDLDRILAQPGEEVEERMTGEEKERENPACESCEIRFPIENNRGEDCYLCPECADELNATEQTKKEGRR